MTEDMFLLEDWLHRASGSGGGGVDPAPIRAACGND